MFGPFLRCGNPPFQNLENVLSTDGWDGMGWMDEWMDGAEYQKCPSIFFKVFEFIENVYTYLDIYSKIITNILMGFRISCQVGGRGPKFQNYCG